MNTPDITYEEAQELVREVIDERNREYMYSSKEEEFFDWLSYEKPRLKIEFMEDTTEPYNDDEFMEYAKEMYNREVD